MPKRRWLIPTFGVLLLAGLVLSVLIGAVLGPGFGPGMMGRGFMPYRPYFAESGWGLMMAAGWLMMVAFWGTLVIIAMLFARWALGGGGTDTPENVLRRRYAAGEITREQFEEACQALRA